ncbi:hypothetical protein DPMN_049825 [Dreissena polymorpha]|uniref:Reverse transcriptase domain-containing protein n=1 Tax=Dreissena polymorpha TaxID=45954 RepID=A0A9D4CF05_DREPO|nr:hypothetical protein DPMN_049715 [Dreissena polymorpha]KAH3724023.1 hypothetical protein DPMN_049825 [Dreissena polymorpha]
MSTFILAFKYMHRVSISLYPSNTYIKGISLEPDEEIKQSLFADDATYFLNDSSYSFDNLIESLTPFGTASGLKLNKSKCTVIRTGNTGISAVHITLRTKELKAITFEKST